MDIGLPETGRARRPGIAGTISAIAAAVALTTLTAAPSHAQAVCWYETAEKMPEAAIAACNKEIRGKTWNRVVDGKTVENKGFRSAIYLSRAMARYELLVSRSGTTADVKVILADLDQSIAANPQERAHYMRALLYELMARFTPGERARYRKLAVQEARAAMAFPGDKSDERYRKIIKENQ